MVVTILKKNRWPMFNCLWMVESKNTQTGLTVGLPLKDLKNYLSMHKEAVKMVK